MYINVYLSYIIMQKANILYIIYLYIYIIFYDLIIHLDRYRDILKYFL